MKMKVLKLTLCVVAIMMVMTAKAQVSFYIDDFHFDEGVYEKEVAICMKNEPSNITGIQMDIYMPEGLSILSDEIGYFIDLGSRTSSRKHDSQQSALQADGAVRVVCASPKLYPFAGNDGDILIITVVADKNFRSGTIKLKNCVATGANTDGSNIVQYKSADYEASVMDYITDIEEIATDDENAEYYTLQGVKIETENISQGVYIKKQGSKSQKVIIK